MHEDHVRVAQVGAGDLAPAVVEDDDRERRASKVGGRRAVVAAAIRVVVHERDHGRVGGGKDGGARLVDLALGGFPET